MKRIIMLLGICFCISGVYAQKFEATPLDEQGDVYEVKIRQFNKLFGKWFTAERVAEPTDGDVAQRSAWRDSCAVKLLTPELKEILKEAADKVYVNLPNKILQELYRRAMDIVMNPGYYKFDGEHDYAIDTIELMQRV